jgi:pimeloyl-ACP methyl ester carboxylesterase
MALDNAFRITFHTQKVSDVEVFYREAGPKDAPVLLLLHSFPTASHMFRNLMPLLASQCGEPRQGHRNHQSKR